MRNTDNNWNGLKTLDYQKKHAVFRQGRPSIYRDRKRKINLEWPNGQWDPVMNNYWILGLNNGAHH